MLAMLATCSNASSSQQADGAIASSGTQSPAEGQPARTEPMAMGTNLDGLAYWNPGLPVIDLMKSASRWLPQTDAEYDTNEAVPLDAAGWVTRLPDAGGASRYRSVLVNVLHDNPAAPPRARYVVLYTGTGTLEVVGVGGAAVVAQGPGRLTLRASDSGGVYLRITALDPARTGAYLRDIAVVREDLLPLSRAGLTFNPAFVEKVAPFRTLRFMDWMNTNVLFDRSGRAIAGDAAIAAAPLLDWTDRPRPSDRSWGDGSRGVPVEAMVEMANRTGAEPWFNMPINASDGYIRGFATYVRDHLDPRLNVHVELSNEVWNWIFPQTRYAQARAHAVFGADAHWMGWYGMRAAQMGAVWRSVFGEPARRHVGGRVRVVYNTQFAWKGLEAEGLDTPRWRDPAGRALHASDWFDDYAITGYYDGTMNTDDSVATVKRWWRDPDGGYVRAIAALRTRITTLNAPLYQYHADQARRRGLALVTYESGFGEYTPPSQRGNDAYTGFLARLQRQPAFYQLEMQNYRAFEAAGGRLFMNFGIIGTPSKWGNWSALEEVSQTTSPRYQALRDWIAANATVRGDIAVVGEARLYSGGPGSETIEGSAHGYDVLVGGAGDDRFVPKGGRESRIDGGGGTDVLSLSAPERAYRVTALANGAVRVAGPDGSEIATRVAQVSFANGRPRPLQGVESSPALRRRAMLPPSRRGVDTVGGIPHASRPPR